MIKSSRSKKPHLQKLYFKKWKLKTYGITIDEYNDMFKKQDFCCAICKSKNGGRKDRNGFAVDHDSLVNYVLWIVDAIKQKKILKNIFIAEVTKNSLGNVGIVHYFCDMAYSIFEEI